ncbi:alpha/beta fold hydrolase [Azohydromonas lata]|uniref:Alpha/beta hydrolase n=1 Tax=Azohydromonas lata TaxID=45677 RepID=A0ABU5IE83_9BURK|nr:alpha/beta hydrolase [Azohydromonas lata]MDZ5457412.1 alpha/beta hydrolase [Azohydromonas lata]
MPPSPEPTPPGTHARVIALHSSASGARQWDAWREHLPAALEFTTPSLMGYAGDNPWHEDTPVSLAEEACRLEPLLAHGGVHLLGHSYGGAVALELALRCPQRVLSLTLYEPVRFGVLRMHDTRTAWQAVLALGQAVREHVRARRLHEAGALFVDYWSGARAWEHCTPRRREAIAACMPKVDAEFAALFADARPLSALCRLRMPVRLLAGSASPAPVLRVAHLLAAALPNAGLCQLDGLGHMGPVTAPAQVAAAVFSRPLPTPAQA